MPSHISTTMACYYVHKFSFKKMKKGQLTGNGVRCS